MKKVVIIFLLIILILIMFSFVYLENYYHPEQVALDALSTTDSVKVSKIKEGYFFDGLGGGTALIFYPGAKVETESYAKFMQKLAENGIDAFLVDMPFRMACFGTNKATSIIENYDYENWIMSGHSFGGSIACNYANKNTEKVNYLVLFGSYPIQKIDDKIKFLSIYGENDGVLNMNSYNKNKELWPLSNSEKIIANGNHAKFGDYGNQKGDNLVDLSSDEQQELSAKCIVNLIREN